VRSLPHPHPHSRHGRTHHPRRRAHRCGGQRRASLPCQRSPQAPIFESQPTLHRGRLQARIGTNLCLGLSGTRDGAKLLLKPCTHASTEIEFDDERDLLIFSQAQRVAEVPSGA
jgi:hypothetical protein